MNNSITPQELTALHERDVHFVLCRAADDGNKKKKSAIASGWQTKAATLEAVLKHHAAGGLLGFIPGRSNLWVLDVDNSQDVDAIRVGLGESAGQALTIVRSKRGAHVYFKKNSSEIRNRQWAFGGLSGDVRGDRGYVIAWDIERLALALDGLLGATPTADGLFPKPGKAAGPHVEGGRNNALNTLIYGKAQAGQTDFHLERDDAIAAGLDPSEVDATIKSATSAATSRTFKHKDADALEAALGTLGTTARFNVRAMCPELSNGGGKWGENNGPLKR